VNPVSQSDGVASADDRLREIVDHLDRDEAAQALERLTPLVSVAKPSLAARFVLAMTAWQLQRFDWALTLLKEAHDDAPDNGGVAEALASLQAQLGQLEESLFTGKLATALGDDPALAALVPQAYPGFDRAFLSIVERPLLGRAREALAQGKLAQAIGLARQHVAIEPTHIEGRAFHADCLMRAGAAAAAVETLKPLADMVPGPSPEFANLYARALTAAKMLLLGTTTPSAPRRPIRSSPRRASSMRLSSVSNMARSDAWRATGLRVSPSRPSRRASTAPAASW
jgi:predicted Zn-dependent protease